MNVVRSRAFLADTKFTNYADKKHHILNLKLYISTLVCDFEHSNNYAASDDGGKRHFNCKQIAITH